LRPITRLTRPSILAIGKAWQRATIGLVDPMAYAHYQRMVANSYNANANIDVLPEFRLVYVSVPKAASSRIKMTLSLLLGREPQTEREANVRRLSGLKSPRRVGIRPFHRVVNDPGALRFTFVRNPYDRLVSCWANKFSGKPLIAGDAFVDQYLALRPKVDASLPAGADQTLSFRDFALFAIATAHARANSHWHVQRDLVELPQIPLDLIGKVESFDRDFRQVFDHVGADDAFRAKVARPVNKSARASTSWSYYYDADLARRVYRAYECDFDRFEYSRALS
jgi:hypothetical protein